MVESWYFSILYWYVCFNGTKSVRPSIRMAVLLGDITTSIMLRQCSLWGPILSHRLLWWLQPLLHQGWGLGVTWQSGLGVFRIISRSLRIHSLVNLSMLIVCVSVNLALGAVFPILTVPGPMLINQPTAET